MERLQEALSRARDRRKEAGAAAPAQTRAQPSDPAQTTSAQSKPQRPTDASVAAAWQSLPQFMPNEKLLKNNRILSYFGGPAAQSFDMMRTKLLQQTKANNWRRIAITSPTAKCGKSTTTANLAFSIARQSEIRVLVIEIDMRRPEIANILGIKENLTFARVLSGQEPPEAHMIAYGNNLAFATNRVPSANSSEILHSAYAREQLIKVEEKFAPDLVLFDAPPVLASDDTIGFLDFVDAAILIAAAEMTSIDEVDVTETEIASHTNVMGVVLNKARYTQGGYGYDQSYY
ncbi:chromosome partitioning protein [Meridianimarinicoccus roseus]|jgi:Mrp family chromosome partitioning ATPase|uniref:Chromosome partitioning protein n=1 Tax=Meridianimarinicoccus roseus TaxID=2072018 RepID=A0A2V2LQB5_9RHOB|nr:CpsD/CapB family tyrosine-protein kinase [Meridianimarinicoccus roseus]PWR04399.1 chromosome partitioning protein [Meridianimarinicoccus roseus]